MSEIKNLSFDDLKQEIDTGAEVLVDFWAPWCNPCKMMLPELESFKKQNQSVNVVKIDIEAHPDAAKKWGVRGIPTVILFRDGEDVIRKTGVLKSSDIKKMTES
jgi:thioredoxin 1